MLYHRANSRSSLRPIACFTEELQCFVCDRATLPIIEKLQSKGIAMHAYGVSVYYTYNGSQLKWTWLELFETNAKIDRGSNFALNNETCFFYA